MNDLISRQALCEYALNQKDKCVTPNDIMRFPSAQPERKKGKWVWNEDGVDWGLGAWCCSECGRKPETWWESDRSNNPLRFAGSKFCGNCGAYMIGEEDEHND